MGFIILVSLMIAGAVGLYLGFFKNARTIDKIILSIAALVVVSGATAIYVSKHISTVKPPKTSVEPPAVIQSSVPKEFEKKTVAPESQTAIKEPQEVKRIANRMTPAEFDDRLLTLIGVDSMGTPEYKGNKIIYGLDEEGTMILIEYTTDDGLTGVDVRVNPVRRDTLVAAVIFYNAIIQAYTPANAEAVFGSLGLDETIRETITGNKSVTKNGYRFEKKWLDKTLVLSVTEN